MIDLSALGLSNVQTPHGGKRDKAGASQNDGKESKNFGDLIYEAGKKNGKKHDAGDHASSGKGIDALADQWADTDELSAAVDKLGAIDKQGIDPLATIDDTDSTDSADLDDGQDPMKALFDSKEATEDDGQKAGGRVRLSAAFQQLMNATAIGDKVPDVAADTNAIDAKPEVKPAKSEKLKKAEVPENSAKAENAANEKSIPDDLTAPEKDTEVSPSRQLHALLGLAPKKDDAEEDVADAPAIKVQQQQDAGNDPAVIAKPGHAVEAVAVEAKADAKAEQAAAQQQVVPQQAAVQTATRASGEKPVEADAGDDRKPARNDTDVVRLVSNDGKSRPVDIELAKDAGDDGTEPATSGKVDFVTVLDSRRYLGFSTDGGPSNASTLTNAIKGEPSWAQVIHSVNTGANRTATEVNTLKLQMNPEHMGNMTASLRLKGDELSVEVRVENVDAYRQLSKDQDSIVKALKDQGFNIDQVSIQLSPSAKADSGSTSQNGSSQNGGNQQGNDQNLQQGGQGDNARQRDESARRNANQNNWDGNDKTSSFNDSGRSTDDANSGNLYL